MDTVVQYLMALVLILVLVAALAGLFMTAVKGGGKASDNFTEISEKLRKNNDEVGFEGGDRYWESRLTSLQPSRPRF